MMKKLLLSLLLFSGIAYGQYPSVLVDLRDDPDATELQINDLQQQQVNLGFDFPLYDQTFKDVWVTYTGVLNFQETVSGGNFCCNGMDMDDPQFQQQAANGGYQHLNYSILAMWTDLNVEYNANPWYKTNSTNATFGWYDIPEFGGTTNLNSFEIKLFDSGDIKFRYDEVNIQNHAVTVGVTGNLELGDYAQFKFKSQANGWQSDVPKVWTFNTLTGVFEDQYGDLTEYGAYVAPMFEDPCEEDPKSCGWYDPADDFGFDDGIYGDDIFDFVPGPDDYSKNAFDDYQASMSLGPAAKDFFEEKYEEDPSFFGYAEEPDYGYVEEVFDGQPEDFSGEPDMFGDAPEFDENIAKELEQLEKEFDEFANENELPMDSFEEVQAAYEEFAPELDEEFSPFAEDFVEQEYFEEEFTHEEPLMSKNDENLLTSNSPVVSAIETSTRINAARRVDAVGIAMNQIETQETLLQEKETQETLLQEIETYNTTSSGEMDFGMSDTGQTFSDGQSSFGDETAFDFSFGGPSVVFTATTIESTTQQSDTQEVLDTSSSTTTTVDQNFDSQADQAFSSGGSISDALTATAPPDFSRFNVAPPSQQEQQTTQKADAQANNMSEEQLEQNLDEFATNMKDSGGFTDQSLTVFLMGRNSNFSQYAGQLQDVSFYTDRGMPGGSIRSDRNSMLRMIGTDNKHEQLIAEQYK
ncbi:hypothetical protein N9H34_00085 [bacterium]|nr:hypothetical protein [bacterium]